MLKISLMPLLNFSQREASGQQQVISMVEKAIFSQF
jgi:hypothetical protein